MIELLSAFIVSGLAVLVHYLAISSKLVNIDPNWCIKKLKAHAKILMLIWVLLLPFYFFSFKSLVDFSALAQYVASYSVYFNYLNGLVALLALFFVYLTFYYVVDRSVSTRLMLEIERSPGKCLSFDEIKRVYHIDTKYANELKGMAEGAFVRKDGEHYMNTFKGSVVAICTAWYKKAFRLGKGG